MAFHETWAALQAHLEPGTTIPNWTIHSGTVGEPFKIASVSPYMIVVDAPGASTHQSVRRTDVEAVYERWDDYLRRGIPRKTFNPLTRQSKYVISMLRWLQDQLGGQLR